MIRVQIGSDEREIGSADEGWINREINQRRADGYSVCVKLIINCKDIYIVLATPTCSSGGGGRAPNGRERAILDLWEKRGLNQVDFSSGNLIAFLKQLPRLL